MGTSLRAVRLALSIPGSTAAGHHWMYVETVPNADERNPSRRRGIKLSRLNDAFRCVDRERPDEDDHAAPSEPARTRRQEEAMVEGQRHPLEEAAIGRPEKKAMDTSPRRTQGTRAQSRINSASIEESPLAMYPTGKDNRTAGADHPPGDDWEQHSDTDQRVMVTPIDEDFLLALAHRRGSPPLCTPAQVGMVTPTDESYNGLTSCEVDDGRTSKQHCTWDDLLHGEYRVLSVSPAVFDDPTKVPVITLYAGMGGFSMGLHSQVPGSFLTYVPVLAVECEAEIQAAHQLTLPGIPCARYFLTDTEDSLHVIARYLPRRLWSRAWVHASPSCRLASNANSRRDEAKAVQTTGWAMNLLKQMQPAVWTMEQAPTMCDYFIGEAEYVENVRMMHYCALPQDRARMIASNREITLERRRQDPPTVRRTLAERKGWPRQPDSSSHRIRNSYANERSVDDVAFTITSGRHQAGACHNESWTPAHELDWIDRAMLQGVLDPANSCRFAPGTTERNKRRMVANMVPPPFGRCLQQAVDSHLQSSKAPRGECFDIEANKPFKDGDGRHATLHHSPARRDRTMSWEKPSRPIGEKEPAPTISRTEAPVHAAGTEEAEMTEATELPPIQEEAESPLSSDEETVPPPSTSDGTRASQQAEVVTTHHDIADVDVWSNEDFMLQAKQWAVSKDLAGDKATTSDNECVTIELALFGAAGELLVDGADKQATLPQVTVSAEQAEQAQAHLVLQVGHTLLLRAERSALVPVASEDDAHLLYAACGHRLTQLRQDKSEHHTPRHMWIAPSDFQYQQWRTDEIEGKIARAIRACRLRDPEADKPLALRIWSIVNPSIPWLDAVLPADKKVKIAWEAEDGAGEIGARRQQGDLVKPVTLDEFKAIFNWDNEESQIKRSLPDNARNEMLQLLWQYRPLFLQPTQLGCADVPEYNLEVTSRKPIAQQPYRTNPEKQAVINREVQKLLDSGCIETSTSPWASPVVLVAKPDKSWRFCIDFRMLNAHTVRDVYPLPRIQDTLHMLGGKSYFTTLDLLSGFWQIRLTDAAKAKTAFVTTEGLYQFRVLAMGLANAPAVFQRAMDKVLASLKWKCCLIYIDDILVYSDTWEQHLRDLAAVFDRLAKHGLFVKPTKCGFGSRRIQYLGHEVAADGIRPSRKHVEAVRDFPRPATKTQLKSFLGLASFNRAYVEDFARVSAPLRNLLANHVPPNLTVPITMSESGHTEQRTMWDEECEQSFRRLKHLLTTAPCLAFPRWDEAFTLRTDASYEGLGAVLRQGTRVIAYLSRGLTAAEARLDVREIECLAVLFACEQLRPYLQNGRPFLIQCDHRNLTWLMNIKHDQGKLARWALRLSEFPFHLEAIPGTANTEADALSRNPARAALSNPISFTSGGAQVAAVGDSDPAPVTMQWQPRVIEPAPGRTELIQAQKNDAFCRTMRERLAKQQDEPAPRGAAPAVAQAHRDGETFCIENGVLVRLETKAGVTRRQMVVPEVYRKAIVWNAHNSAMGGHVGRDRTIARLQEDYFWPSMVSQVKEWVKTCQECQKSRATRPRNKGLMQIPEPSTRPFQTVGIDLLGPLPLSVHGNRWCLTVIDHFSHWPILIPLPNKEATTIAEALFSKVICEHGAFGRLLSDREATLAAPVVADLVKLIRAKRVFTSAYSPSTNGVTERYHRVVNAALRTYANLSPTSKDWETSLLIAQFTYRITPLTGTEFSPFYLLFGRHPVMPQDALKLSEPQLLKSKHEYVANMQERLATAHELLREIHVRLKKRMKSHYDKGRVDVELEVGDNVLAYYPPLENSKIFYAWRGPFVIVEKCSPLTYRLKNPETGEVYPELANINRLARYHPIEHASWLREGGGGVSDAEGAVGAVAESPPERLLAGSACHGTTQDEEEKPQEDGDENKNETQNTTVNMTDQDALPSTTPALRVRFQVGNAKRQTRAMTEDRLRAKEWSAALDEAIELALSAPGYGADQGPDKIFCPAPTHGLVKATPLMKPGMHVIVRLALEEYDTLIPTAERAAKSRRGRVARAAPARGAHRETQDLHWRVAEILQILPATPTDEGQIHVHFYDTAQHHRDVTERQFHPAYRDTTADKDVYTSAFRGTIAKPTHFIEFKDTVPFSTLLVKPFALRKDSTLPNATVQELLPHLYVQLSPQRQPAGRGAPGQGAGV